MGAGYSRINALTIKQTSQGFAEFLLQFKPRTPEMMVIIAHDARHNSEKFAELTAAVFIAKGFNICWYQELAHTPLVPFAIKEFKQGWDVRAAHTLLVPFAIKEFKQAWDVRAGIMITASHNPAQDNGYKVYDSNGCQINSPMDQMISEKILANLEPIDTNDFIAKHPMVFPNSHPIKEAYKQSVAEYLQGGAPQDIPAFVYTPMHGVGLIYMVDMLKSNFNQDINDPSAPVVQDKMTVVTSQSDPDPDFPTVKYPNPEEDGALDEAKKTADDIGVGLILAHDPDADRFAAAEKVNGQWHQFTGDQVGVLLAYYIFTQLHRKPTGDDVMIVSTVSSRMLWEMGDREGFTVAETLTGFKWIGQKACMLEHHQKSVHFGYEEALGYMFPAISYDKDGVVAAGVFLKACAAWGSPHAMLHQLYQEYGYYETMNTYWHCSDAAATVSVFEKIRSSHLAITLSQFNIERTIDLSDGFDSGTPDHISTLPASRNALMLTCWLAPAWGTTGLCRGGRFTIRASGTEPKIKLYLECWDADPQKARDGTATILKGVKEAYFSDESFVIEEKYKSL